MEDIFKITEEGLLKSGFSKIFERQYKTIIKGQELGNEIGFIELIDMGHYWDLTIETLGGGCHKPIHDIFEFGDCLRIFINMYDYYFEKVNE